MNLGDYLKEKRKEKGLSQRKLAELSGVSNTEISRLESGDRQNPSPKTLKAISPYLGVSYSELLKEAGYIDETIGEEITNLNTQKTTDTTINHLYNDLKDATNVDFIKLMIKASKDLQDEDLQVIKDLTNLLLSKQPKEFKSYISYINI